MPKFLVYIEETPEDMFVASCPSFPGCVSQGDTADEALKGLRYSMSGYIASLRKHSEPIPEGVTDRVYRVEVVKI